MKKHLILISKILLSIFIILCICIIGIAWWIFDKNLEIKIEGYYIVPVIIITILTGVVFLIMFVWEMIAKIREKGKGTIIKFIAEIFLMFILCMTTDMLVLNNKSDILFIFGLATGICVISFALDFWKRKYE